jgi:WD40 repeat protein
MLFRLSKILSVTTVVTLLSFSISPADAALLVTSALNNTVKAYDEQGNFIRDFVTSGNGLNNPDGLGIGPDGNLYVSNTLGGGINRYDGKTGQYLGVFVPDMSGNNSAMLGAPTDLTFGPDGNLYVSSFPNTPNLGRGGSDSILSFDGQTGAFLQAFLPPPGTPNDAFGPLGLTFGPDGNLYVASLLDNSVLRYNTSTGALIDKFVAPGSGGLSKPTGLAFHNGNLYVASFDNNNILRFNAQTGQFVDEIVAPGSGGLSGPSGLKISPLGALFVNSYFSNSVAAYNADTGAFIKSFVQPNEGGLQGPNMGITFAQISVPVPEPSAELGLLLFGACSVGSVMKRQLKNSKVKNTVGVVGDAN